MNKFLAVLQSRKFWFSVLGIMGSMGIVTFSDSQSAELVAQIVGGITAILVISTGLEDGMRGMGSQAQFILDQFLGEDTDEEVK